MIRGRALCVIIGRAGSRGLPGKNSHLLRGRPLICRTIDAARAAGELDRIVVSTDGDAIAAAAASMGVSVVRRPAELASDTARVDDAVRHAVAETGSGEEIIVILYANVPVRPAGLIDRAIRELIRSGADSVQSYAPIGKHHPAWMVAIDAGRVRPIAAGATHRRQDLPPLYVPDGGVIAVRRDCLLAPRGDPHAFLGRDRRGIETAPGEVVDVDTAQDLAVAEAILDAAAPAPGIDIAGRRIAVGQPPYVIAELGVNHDGSAKRGIELVRAARRAGADAVKLQWFETGRLLSRAARLAAYQARGGATDPFAMLRGLELGSAAMRDIAESARSAGLHAIVTVFSVDLVQEAAGLAFDAFKTASPDVVNRPLLDALAAAGRPLLVSTGAATAAEILAASAWLGDHPYLLMQCVSAYPTPDDCAALAGRAAISRLNPRALGYSDHTTSEDTGALAVAAGAVVLEKHLTFDRGAAGPDHACSLDPDGFARYVHLAHRAWRMLGEASKTVQPIERDSRDVSRQSVTTRAAMPAGHVLGPQELTIKRPGMGIAPSRLAETVGRRLARAVEADMPLRDEDLC